jgi:hypothetical protein
LCWSLLVSTHVVPHRSGVGAVQLIAHIPALHEGEPVPIVGPEHAVPQTPPAPHPFCGPGVSHVPLQLSVPPGQPHIPLEQTWPPLHAFPQLPQLLLLVV